MHTRTTLWCWLLILGLLLPTTGAAQSNNTENDWEGKNPWEFFLSFALDSRQAIMGRQLTGNQVPKPP